jgi:hypothetical protein
MSASEAPALTAIAFQLAAALDAYAQDVEAMVTQRMDPEVYQRVSGDMDKMRLYSSSLPRLSVSWVEVMIRHFELTHGLWREQKGQADRAEIERLHANQRHAVMRLRQQALALLVAGTDARA